MASRIVNIVAVVCVAVATAALAGEATVTVKVKQLALRADRQFYAPTVAQVHQKDQLVVVGQQADWLKVTVRGKTGWVHRSGVVSADAAETGGGPLSFFGGGDRGKVTQQEVALAGKGFNDKVERAYKQKNPQLDFSAVDRMERLGIKDENLLVFVREGRLHAHELAAN